MTELDRALDALYAESPANFTKKRDELVRELARAEDKAELKNRRKPTQIAWVLNQLSRRHADDVADLVDVGRELARAQRKAVRDGGASGLREAIARQREVVSRLTNETATLMRELGVSPSGHLDEIAGALQAALVDPQVGAALEEGRLEKVPGPAVGFAEARSDLTPTPREKARKSKEKKQTVAEARAAKRREEREAKKRAAEEARAARQRARDEEIAMKARAKSEARAAAEEAEKLERIAKEARRAADVAKKHARELARRAR